MNTNKNIFRECNICYDLTSSRNMIFKKKNAEDILKRKNIQYAIMNIYYIKIIKGRKKYLCKNCYNNTSTVYSLKDINSREIYGKFRK